MTDAVRDVEGAKDDVRPVPEERRQRAADMQAAEVMEVGEPLSENEWCGRRHGRDYAEHGVE